MFRRVAAVLSVVALASGVAPAAALAHPGDDRHAHGTSSLPARFNPCATVNYAVNAAQAKPGALNDVKAAMARVHRETGLTFRYVGATTRLTTQPYPAGVQLLVEWVKPGQGGLQAFRTAAPSGYGGYTSRTAYLTDGRRAERILQGRVSMNSARQDYPAGAGSTDPRRGGAGSRGQLLVHEIAHAVGLQHSRSAADVMHPVMTHRNVHPTAADKRQFQAVGRAGGCLYDRDPMYAPRPAPEPAAAPSSTTPSGTEASSTTSAPSSGSPAGSSSVPADAPAPAAEAFDLVNAERQKAGVAPLRWLECARGSSQRHSQAQAEQERMHHQSDGALEAACEGDRGWSENVAWTSATEGAARHAVAMWMASDGHRAALLDPAFTHAGVGHVRSAGGRHYFTQVFVDAAQAG